MFRTISMIAATLAALGPTAAHAALNACPAVTDIHQSVGNATIVYTATANGGTWHGEHPRAAEGMLAHLRFSGARFDARKHKVVCDYVADAALGGALRMSLSDATRAVGAAWVASSDASSGPAWTCAERNPVKCAFSTK
ncbi:DUF3757 domain-containing protein [Pandoraea pnomenusa]|uniref:DUF3757 domain-containing protein n=1 Tax=Pandoraea pnomenusa TaxID=93220 RepID=UPI001198B4EA|nr:DUF3757 domain-containing protein [Pandoraea pnomenusa]QDX22959.1 DUF3757 domain-containing protein [Pandoraea pnomenusa]